MKRYRDIKLSTDANEMDDIFFEEEMLDFSYNPGEDEELDEELEEELEAFEKEFGESLEDEAVLETE